MITEAELIVTLFEECKDGDHLSFFYKILEKEVLREKIKLLKEQTWDERLTVTTSLEREFQKGVCFERRMSNERLFVQITELEKQLE